MDSLFKVFYDLSVYSLLIPSLVFILRWKYSNFPIKVIGIYIVLASTMSILAIYLAKYGESTDFLFHLNPSIDIICISLFWLYHFKNKTLNWIIGIICLCYCSIMAYSYFNLAQNEFLNTPLINMETTYVIIMISILFNKLMKEQKDKSSSKNPVIWVMIYLLASNIFSLGLTLFANQIYAYSKEIFDLVWYGISPFFTVVNCLILAYAFWITKKYALSKI